MTYISQGVRGHSDAHNAGPQQKGPRGGSFYFNGRGQKVYGTPPPPMPLKANGPAERQSQVAGAAAVGRKSTVAAPALRAAPIVSAAGGGGGGGGGPAAPKVPVASAPTQVKQAPKGMHTNAPPRAVAQVQHAPHPVLSPEHPAAKVLEKRGSLASRVDAHLAAEHPAAKAAEHHAELAKHTETHPHPATPPVKSPAEAARHQAQVAEAYHGPEEHEKLIREHLTNLRGAGEILKYSPLSDVGMNSHMPDGVTRLEQLNHNGHYYMKDGRSVLVIQDTPSTPTMTAGKFLEQRWGRHELVNGETQGTQQDRGVRHVLTHETGHHLQAVGDPRHEVIEEAFAHPDRKPVSTYARKNPLEYFAETYAVYHYAPEALLRNDPVGHAMVTEVLRRAEESIKPMKEFEESRRKR